jgi:hypothetical protein
MIVSNPKGSRSLKRSTKTMAKRRQPAALRKYWASHSHKRRSKKRYVARAANPRRRHRHRNPISFSASGLTNKLAPALIGAVSALGADLLLQKTPIGGYIPAAFSTGYLKYIPRALAVYAAAFVLGKVKPSWKNEALAGGLAVVAYSALKDVANNVGGMSLADYDDVPDYSTLGYMGPGAQVGSYMQNYPNLSVARTPSPVHGPIGAYMLNDYNTANLD